jgi:hypothetical protein
MSRLKTGKRCVTVATKSRLFELWDAMPNFPKMAELKWVVSTDPYFNRFPKAQNHASTLSHLRNWSHT